MNIQFKTVIIRDPDNNLNFFEKPYSEGVNLTKL